MTEEVSSQMRLSVTVALLASAVAVVVNILVMWIGVIQGFSDTYVAANNQVFSSTISELQSKDSIESTVIYKVARESDQICMIKIVNSSGTVLRTFDFKAASIENDLKYFITNANKRFNVKVDVRDGYVLTLLEVD